MLKPDINLLRNSIFSKEKRISAPMECVHEFASHINGFFCDLYHAATVEYGYGHQICLVAVGGYGRGELCPYSDIDLMLLYADGTPASVIKHIERKAWDMGLLLGFTARTLPECAWILGDDHATDTSMLDSTFITGNKDLYARYTNRILHPFFIRQRKSFPAEMRKALISGVHSTADTLYRIEPDIKSGICCLRDCQRIAWAQRIIQKAIGGQLPLEYQFLGTDEMKRLVDCYAFLTKLRTELHMLGKRRLDVLEVRLQPAVAQSLGYPDFAPAALMGDFFKVVSFVKQCILSFTEQAHFRKGVMTVIRSRLASFVTHDGLLVIDGILYMRKNTRDTTTTAAWVMGVFSTAIMYHAEIGTALRITIREAADRLTPDDFRDNACEAQFCSILGARQPSGRIIQIMHETGILNLVIPEFMPLTCRVEFDTYHEYTTDQHTLMALSAFDELEHDNDPLLKHIHSKIADKRVIRLAILLHDVGKPIEGDHCINSAIIALAASCRFGFDEQEQELVEYLVNHHLDLSDLSLRREMEEDALHQFADTVHTIQRLEMLYILTVLDIRHVGSRTWTGWKAAQLSGLFTQTEKILLEKMHPAVTAPLVLQPDCTKEPVSVCPRLLPDKLTGRPINNDLSMHVEEHNGFYRITVTTSDRISLLSDIAASFIAAGLQIMSAQLHSYDDGNVIDTFDVEPDETTKTTFAERRNRFMKTWDLLNKKQMTSEAIVAARFRNYPKKVLRQIEFPPSVTINNDDSSRYTIIEVHASDRFGLLHTLASVLGEHNVNIVAARISTAVDAAIDVFYVSDPDGKKISDAKELDKIKRVVVERLMQ